MTDVDEADAARATSPSSALVGSVATAVVLGAGLGVTARLGAAELLIAIAVVQALAAVAIVFGLQFPGRQGALVLGALAAAGADVMVSVWPHSRLGTLLAVLGLALPLLIAHQLLRGAARTRVLESLGGTALLVVTLVALPAFLQLRHEIINSTTAGKVVFGVVVALAAALAVGGLTDLVVSAPRFDAGVPRGLLAVVAAGVVGALVGYLALRDTAEFAGGRGLFAGGSLGLLAALVAVGVAFAEATAPPTPSASARRLRPLLTAVVPISVLAPVAFLLCLAIRA